MIKIPRDICLIKYRNFPLRSFEKDVSIDFFPQYHSYYWVKLDYKSRKGLTNLLSAELTKLYKNLNVENLIFFGDYNRNWISKFTEARQDYKSIVESVNYFKKNKVTTRFKGAISVSITELNEFIKHFYILTVCDSGFVHYHFLDENQNLLGFIHYSGEVSFTCLNANTNELFLNEISKTKFTDALRENTNRI